MTPTATDLEQFFRVMAINGAAQLLTMDRRYKFLAVCAEQPLTLAEIAQRCGSHEKPTRLVMEGFVALGLAKENAAQFSLAPLGKLLALTPEILGNRFWDHLPEYLKTGEPIIKMDVVQHQAEHYQAEVGPLGWMLTTAAEEVAQLLGVGDQRRGFRILDVGAGSAVWSLAMIRCDQSSTVIALDWPEVLKVAQEQAKMQGLQAQLDVIQGDFNEVPLPKEAFDLGILANITHLQTPERNQHLFKRIYEALDANGEAVIIDVFPGAPEGDLMRVLYRLGLALRTEHGQVYSQEQLSGELREAGFASCKLTLLKSPPYILGMLLAAKQRN